jgi:CubicO group peptidase (beta-lactamase class C family)
MSHLTSGGPAVRRTALAIVLGLSAAVLSPMPGRADAPALPRSTPEAQGVSSPRLLAFVDAADRNIDAMNSFMLLRHGQVVAEGWWAPYDAQQRHLLYSLTKSFTSTAVGLAIAEGKLTLDDKVLSHFPDAAPAAPGDELKAMRVRDLLTMSTGHHAEPAFTPKEPWTKTFLSAPVAHKPGTFFLYNSPASYMLSATVQKVTGTPLRAWLGPRLFDIIGITDPVWETSPEGISIGGTGLKLKTEDIARFGQLYLRKGEWQGKRVLPAAWVELATSRQMSNGSNPESDWEQGYGFQFWRTRHGYYRGDGAFGQFCVILQDLDAVVVITSGVRSMPAVLNLVWEHLLPAIEKAPLPADETNRQKLTSRLAGLRLPTQTGAPSATIATQVAGKRYTFDPNDQKIESLALEIGENGAVTLVGRINGADYRTTAGFGQWAKGRFAFGALGDQPVAVSGAWAADDTYKAIVRFTETPFAVTLTLRFANGQLVLDSEMNPSRGPAKQPTLTSVSKTN